MIENFASSMWSNDHLDPGARMTCPLEDYLAVDVCVYIFLRLVPRQVLDWHKHEIVWLHIVRPVIPGHPPYLYILKAFFFQML